MRMKFQSHGTEKENAIIKDGCSLRGDKDDDEEKKEKKIIMEKMKSKECVCANFCAVDKQPKRARALSKQTHKKLYAESSVREKERSWVNEEAVVFVFVYVCAQH